MNLKHLGLRTFNSWLHGLGLKLVVRRPVRDAADLLAVKTRELGVGTVFDVGANIGQFAIELRKAGFSGRIVSFEPLTAAHSALVQAAASDPVWTVAPRMALGAEATTSRINVAHNLVSSSLLLVEDRSVDAAPDSGFAGVEEIEVRPLDAVVDPVWPRPFALKLDTQGFEMEVLKGASATLSDVAIILVEMSIVPLYRGGASFVDIFDYLERQGFKCISLVQGFADHVRNELLQVDGVFVRA